MAVITATPQTWTSRYPTASVLLTFNAVGNSDTARVKNTGDLAIIWKNSHATNGATVATSSVAHPGTGRLGDIAAEALAAGAERFFGPMELAGWTDSSGYLNFTAGGTGTLSFAVVKLF